MRDERLNVSVCRQRNPCATWSVFGVLLLGLGACTSVPPVRPPVPEPALTPETVLSTLRSREANIKSLKGLFQADIRGSDLLFPYRIQGTLFYQRPQSIRITGVTRLGGTAFDFLVRDDTYVLRVPGQPNIVVGRMDDLTRLGDLRVPVQLSVCALQVLLGKIPGTSDHQVRLENGSYQYTMPVSSEDSLIGSADGLQRVLVDRHSAQIHAIEYLTSDKRTQLAFTASDFQPVRDASNAQMNAIMLPFTIEARDHTTSGSVELEFLELVANVPLSEEAFGFR